MMWRPPPSMRLNPRLSAFAITALFCAYAFSPGDPDGLLPGWPWRDMGGAILALAVLCALANWAAPPRRRFIALLVGLLVATAVRVELAALITPRGWAAEFFLRTGDHYTRVERFVPHTSDGFDIERVPELTPASRALQFLNAGEIPGADGAPAQTPLGLRVHGTFVLESASAVELEADGNGIIEATIDDVKVPVKSSNTLAAGPHEIVVSMRKPAMVAPRLSVAVREDNRPLTIYAEDIEATQLADSRWIPRALRVLDLIVIALGLVWLVARLRALFEMLRRQPLRASMSGPWFLIAVPVLLFALQGLVVAHDRSALTVFGVGDDMRAYAAQGRSIALHGLLANDGLPLFKGQPFYYYPLYPYFVALGHALFDESFYGIVLLQFVLLGVTFGAISVGALELFGATTAWLSLLLLTMLGELAFTRYYTVSVFSDNLYYPLVALSVWALNRFDRAPAIRTALAAGVLGGLATITRPSMFFVLPLVIAWIVLRRAPIRMPARSTLALATGWMAVLLAVTLRNWLVSGRAVFIAESSVQILVFLAPPGVDYRAYREVTRPSIAQTLHAAFRMFMDHPLGVILVEARKLAFMMGFTNLMPGYRLHPEFLAMTSGYGAWWVRHRRNASGAMLHLTLAGHVVAFLVASPTTYGYKTMLTLMMLAVPFTADVIVAQVKRLRARLVAPAQPGVSVL